MEIIEFAFDLTAAIHRQRARELVEGQIARWLNREKDLGVVLCPPSVEQLNIATAALTKARDAWLHDVIVQVNREIDGIDNGSKRKAREVLSELADKLKKQQSTHYALAK
jgi:hypothetical protein